jgi:hypothetical protein
MLTVLQMTRIITWLQLIKRRDEEVEICFDYQTDWDLFVDALDHRVPAWCREWLVEHDINELLRYEFHQKHNLPEHHALYDALANLYAFRKRPDVAFKIDTGDESDT